MLVQVTNVLEFQDSFLFLPFGLKALGFVSYCFISKFHFFFLSSDKAFGFPEDSSKLDFPLLLIGSTDYAIPFPALEMYMPNRLKVDPLFGRELYI